MVQQQRSIAELARTVGFRGSASHRVAEPSPVQNLPVINNATPGFPAMRTSVDTYVTGQYVQKGGKVVEVTQRYTIFVSYDSQSQPQTMQEIRNRIASDFRARYGLSFNIASVHVPGLPIPNPQPQQSQQTEMEAAQMYGGSRLFREMTRFEKARYDIGTEKLKSRLNIQSIKERYKL